MVTMCDELSALRTWCSAAILGQRPHQAAEQLSISDAAFSDATPFSFVYDGKSSAEFLPSWKRSVEKGINDDGREQHVITWLDPETGLQIVCEATIYADYPAVEWLLRLTNTGRADTPIIEKILPLDMTVTPRKQNGIMLHSVHGSDMTLADFLPRDCSVDPLADIALSHPGSIPYFHTEWEGGGVIGGIGWSGPWSMRLRRNKDTELCFQAGQKVTHLKLHPGETIRTPRILLVTWQGHDRVRGHNFLRRLLFAHYVPKQNGQPAVVPISHTTAFDEIKHKDLRSNMEEGLNAVTEDNQLEIIRRMPSIGVENFWIDAGWYVGGYSNTVGKGGCGSWTPKPESFPRGMKPISDAAKQKGMKFLLWFCSEYVEPGSEIDREHPEWVSKLTFQMGDPAARAWMTDFLSDCITKWGIDIFREDGGFWGLPNFMPPDSPSLIPIANNLEAQTSLAQVTDSTDPDRQGIAEIRHIEGVYIMWDDLLRRHPGLLIDAANSRCRGCDIEMVKRSIGSLTRSEATFWGDKLSYEQAGTAALSQYVPMWGSMVVGFDPYMVRSVATSGICFGLPDPRDEDFPAEQARQAFEEIKSLRPYWSGDFYPLIEKIDADEHNWAAWQLHRPNQDAGYAVFFRRPKSPFVSIAAGLRGLNPTSEYEVVFKETYEIKQKRVMSGRQLQALRVDLDKAPGSLLLIYRQSLSGKTRPSF